MIQNFIQTLFNEKVQLPNEIGRFKDCLNDKDFLSVGSTIYSLLKRQNKLHQTPDFFQIKLQEIYTDTLYKNIFIKNQTLQILNEFEKRGIEVIPIKGPLFTEKYFGDLGARYSSDIDLLVRKEDVNRAVECIKQLGFRTEKEEIEQHFHCGFYKEITNSPCPLAVELHWDLVKEDTSNMDLRAFWGEAVRFQSTYHYVKELSDYHAFYMICLHGWRHNLDSLKYYLDIIQMINVLSFSLDFSRLIKEAEKHQTKKRLIRTLSNVYNQYPFLASIKYFPSQIYGKSKSYKISEKKPLNQYIDFLDYQFLSYDSLTHRLIEFKKWLIPSKSEMSLQLGLTNNSFLILDYFTLYKRRVTNFWNTLW
ncbi:nucleotidyltransferase family protein [Fictibacillus halophilus]|uniref:nucleotidyltransferase domain-containing protein n=1 Tax=Fictibacillus halophilus TaxID=1610490 RepID=UPI003644048B